MGFPVHPSIKQSIHPTYKTYMLFVDIGRGLKQYPGQTTRLLGWTLNTRAEKEAGFRAKVAEGHRQKNTRRTPDDKREDREERREDNHNSKHALSFTRGHCSFVFLNSSRRPEQLRTVIEERILDRKIWKFEV